MEIAIRTNFPKVQRKLDALQKDVAARALASAVNKTLDRAKTAMVREIAAEFVVKQAYVRERLRIRRATRKGGLYAIEGALIGGGNRGRSANIIAFVEKSVTLAEAKRRAKAGTQNQLFVRIKRGAGRKPLKGAFIGNKGRTVFQRVGKSRLPIEPVQTIDVAQMFNTKRINAAVIKAVRDVFPAIFDREAAFFVQRFNRP